MSEAAANPQQDSLRRFVWISLIFHIAVGLAFTIKNVFFAGEAIEYQSAVRVDLLGLPDKIKPEVVKDALPAPPAPPSPQAKKQYEKPAPEVVEKPEKEQPPLKELVKKVNKKDPDAINLDRHNQLKQKEALNRLKQMSALEKLQEEVAAEPKKVAAAAPAAKPIKGAAISSGSQLTGLSKIQADNFIGDVEKKIRQNWALPQWLAGKNLSAQVRVRFDNNGNILSAQIVKSSGNSSFDEIVIDTVHKSSPLPAPPEKFVRLMSLEGILFGFPE